MPYRLSALAEQDLEEIRSYVAEDASPETVRIAGIQGKLFAQPERSDLEAQ